MALASPIPSPSLSKKSEVRKISAPARVVTELAAAAADEDTEAGTPAPEAQKTKVPCEFCHEACSLEALMRHQVI